MTSSAEAKKLYLCSGCRKMGVRSSRSKVFETFNCPRCRREQTLFLPKSEIDKQAAEEAVIHEQAATDSENPREPALQSSHSDRPRHWLGIRDFFTFMLGFVWALFILRYSR